MSDLSGPRRAGLKDDIRRARRLEWLSIAYLCSTITILVVVMAGSQALKTEFVGDALSMIAPIVFLVGDRISNREATETYPFGFERATTAAYLAAALALLVTGLYLFVDSAFKLVALEHPIIGGRAVFGHVVWIGWLGIAALLWSSVPAYFLGRAKTRLAHRICDKVLLADARTNAADWKSAAAAMLGVVGIAIGLWWADALAALFISIEIALDGWREVRSAVGDIMDRRPQKLGETDLDPLPERLTSQLKEQDWVSDVVVRVRERGREFIAEAIVVPKGQLDAAQIEDGIAAARKLDDRLRDVAIVPVRKLGAELEAIRAEQ